MTELLEGAVKALRKAIDPLAYRQPSWTGTRVEWADSLYARMRGALDEATNTTGAPLRQSKAPTRMDCLAWFVEVDAAVAHYPGTGDTLTKLMGYHNQTWTPDHLGLIKAITYNCERWADQARDILGDNPPSVPLRRPCPLCVELWHYPPSGDRDYALKVTATLDNWHAVCAACRTTWASPSEQALFRRLIDTPA